MVFQRGYNDLRKSSGDRNALSTQGSFSESLTSRRFAHSADGQFRNMGRFCLVRSLNS